MPENESKNDSQNQEKPKPPPTTDIGALGSYLKKSEDGDKIHKRDPNELRKTMEEK